MSINIETIASLAKPLKVKEEKASEDSGLSIRDCLPVQTYAQIAALQAKLEGKDPPVVAPARICGDCTRFLPVSSGGGLCSVAGVRSRHAPACDSGISKRAWIVGRGD